MKGYLHNGERDRNFNGKIMKLSPGRLYIFLNSLEEIIKMLEVWPKPLIIFGRQLIYLRYT